jgi:hypothetical protein
MLNEKITFCDHAEQALSGLLASPDTRPKAGATFNGGTRRRNPGDDTGYHSRGFFLPGFLCLSSFSTTLLIFHC